MTINQNIITLAGGVFLFILFCWMIVFQLRLRKMFRGSNAEGLESLIRQNVDAISILKKKFEENEKALRALEQELEKSARHIGMVRFNAFHEAGGEQSFSFAALDDNKNGVVISSLHNRESNRVYAKPVIKAESHYMLSEEEKEAIRRALAR